jgi:hypothetical protein
MIVLPDKFTPTLIMKKTTTHSTTLNDTQLNLAFMKWLLFFGILFGIQNSFAQTNTWDGSSSNAWNTAANWSQNHVPTSGEDVVIPNVATDPRYAVTTTTVKSITIQNGGNLVFERATAYALIVTGSVTVSTGGTFTMRTAGGAATSTLTIGGDFVNNGSVDFVDNSVINLIFNGASSQTISGSGASMDLYAVTLNTASAFVINRAIDVDSNWTNNGKTVSGTGSVNFGGTTAIGGTTLTAFPNLTVSGTVTQGVNTSVSGNFSKTAGTYNISSSAISYTLAVTGNFSQSGGTFNVSNGANSSILTVGGTFGLSGGTFIIENTTTATGGSVTVTGLTTISGTGVIIMDFAGSAATCSFNAIDFTTSGTGGNSIDSNRNNCSLDFGNGSTVNHCQFKISGNFVHSSTNVFYTSSSSQVGSIIFNKTGTQTLSYSGTNSQYTSMTINSGTTLQLLTNLTFGSSNGLPASTVLVNGTLDAQAFIIGGANTSGEIFNLASGATLITANTNGIVSTTVGTVSTTMGTRTFNAAANYIFDGSANQTANFSNTIINNLTISNTGGSVILNAAPTVNGTLAITAGTLDSAAFQIIGNVTNNFTLASGTSFRTSGSTTANFPTLFTTGHCVFNAASTVEYYGATQTISATPTYGNLNISAVGTKTAGGALSVVGNLSIATGAIGNLGSTTTHTAGTLTLGGLGTAAGKFGSISTSATAPVFKNNTYFTAGTTGYITVGTSSCTAPTITFSSIPSICQGAPSYSIPYTAVTGAPDLYTISGTGITSVTNGALGAPSASITVGLSPAPLPGTITPSAFTVSSSVTGCSSANLSGSVSVTPTVGTPTTPSPAATTICQASANTTYTTSAANATSYTWSVTGAGNSITGTGTTGTVTWGSGFNGSATVSVVANGCNGPSTSASTTVTVTPTVGTPSFSLGATTVCQNAVDEIYTASSTNTTGITYSVSPGSAGTIGSTSGVMDWNAGFSGPATITASAAGCGGPKTANRVVTVTATVGTPSTPSPAASTICQASANTNYTTSATNATSYTWSVTGAGNSIVGTGTTGTVTWGSGFTGSATVSVVANGCNSPSASSSTTVTVTPTIGTPSFTVGAATLCQNSADTTYTAIAANTSAITYTVLPAAAGTIGSTNGLMNWSSTFSGNATITASAAGCGGPKTADKVVVITPSVATPSFTAGATTVCQDAADETYTVSAANNTGITYTVSPAGAGTIDSTSGVMNWDASFSGSATITASAAGCSGPKTATRTVTVTATVGTPAFTFGSTTVCQDASTSTYAASASDNTGITYSVSPAAAGSMSTSFGFGFMNWSSTFNGTATITATAAGCNGPKSANLSVTVTPTVGIPVFTAGATTVCQDAADELYAASASDATGITYTVSPAAAGTIGSSSGIMNWSPAFSGSATITASAAGCNGPKTANIVVTVTPTVGTPSFTTGATTVCQDAADTTYTATATNSTAITYTVLPAIAGTIGSSTGIMDWNPTFSGNATITASAAGCNGPKTIITVVTVTPTVGTPSFTLGATTVCQDSADTTYTATATNSTGITYSVSPAGAGTIGSSTGIINWNASFNGAATIIASAAGCNGPATSNRVVTVTPTVGAPSFNAGAITVCQDDVDTTYSATATNSTGITYSVSPVGAGVIGSSTGIINWNAGFSGIATITASAIGCNGPITSDRIVTVNPLPVVTASDVTGCSGSSIALSGSATPTGGLGNYSVSDPYVGTSNTTYTFTYTAPNGCSATSDPANIIITPQPLWYLDADGDHYYAGAGVPSCSSPGIGYTNTGLLGGDDCDDNSTLFNPGATDICYNNIDENCNGILSDGCAPVVVNMTASYHNTTLPSLATAVPAVAYEYPGASNIKYRYSVTNLTTGVTAPDVIQTSRYITIPGAIHSYNSQYSIKASAVINEEVVAFAGNTVTVNSPTIQMISLNTATCGTTLAALTTTISANPGLNATGYTFRIRLNDSNPTPTYAYSQSATRFVSANSFTGFPLQYSASYKISVQYTSTDPSTNLPVQSGYGAECTVNTPSIPTTNLASPVCNSQVAALNANISAAAASYATSYQFRIRLFTDNGPTPTYYYSVPNASRFSSLTAFQGITYAYNTNYVISVQYSILSGSTTVWSGYGAECKIKTPFFPVTSLIPNQCGLSTPTALTQQLNISPYPGFPNYKVKLEEIDGEDVVNSEERVITYSHFKLSDFSIAQLDKNYNISVAIKINGVFGDYDSACDVFTQSEQGRSNLVKSAPFKAVAYPNPFADNFMLDIKTTSQSSVNIKVYDMVGRMIEQKDVRVSDMENLTIGNQYPSGVYNVIVSQENSVQTVKVIKR